MKIVITGAYGQVGSDCVAVLGTPVCHEVTAIARRDLDISDAAAVDQTMSDVKPDIILNCGAFTNVDACERERDKAWAVNVDGPRNLAEAARKRDAWLIHISSDYVFDGKKTVPEPYYEDDQPAPLSFYGVTKLEGERAIRDSGARSTILRTAWVYGANGANFLKTILRLALAENNAPLKVVNDQVGSLTWSHRLARQVEKIIQNNALGLFHATAEGHGSWYEAAMAFLAEMEINKEIRPCTTEEFPRPAPRPHNSILENRALKAADINIMRDWREDLGLFVARHKERLIRETADH